MAKVKSVFYCQNCGADSPKWLGKCPSCNEWNTYVEEKVVQKKSGEQKVLNTKTSIPTPLNDVQGDKLPRVETQINELNRVLGGGFVPGSVTLLGGEPGIGKSTLSLQLCLELKDRRTLYISGEESASQIKLRADRLKGSQENCTIYTETDVVKVVKQMEELEPELVVIDSVQTLNHPLIESASGSISQIRECSAEVIRYAKTFDVPVILIGHITKEGSIAGPKVLEHMVDTVLQFEGDRNHLYRILRSGKNRFGSTQEIGIFEMQLEGLIEVKNPSQILVNQRHGDLSGIAISASMEGDRPLLIETQALASSAVYGTPQRSSTGFDLRRLSMLLAVLEKRCGFKLGMKDVFLNMAGGIKVDDPAIDLAVVCAVLSSSEDIPVGPRNCFAGEVGLSGEIRPVSRIEQRILEAQKLGFETFYLSEFTYNNLNDSDYSIELVPARKVDEIFSILFG